ncbi:hypothetical protein ACFL2V_19015, partial [Pseudomonadota bacterium]
FNPNHLIKKPSLPSLKPKKPRKNDHRADLLHSWNHLFFLFNTDSTCRCDWCFSFDAKNEEPKKGNF